MTTATSFWNETDDGATASFTGEGGEPLIASIWTRSPGNVWWLVARDQSAHRRSVHSGRTNSVESAKRAIESAYAIPPTV